jgi:hypothetical protein
MRHCKTKRCRNCESPFLNLKLPSRWAPDVEAEERCDQCNGLYKNNNNKDQNPKTTAALASSWGDKSNTKGQ